MKPNETASSVQRRPVAAVLMTALWLLTALFFHLSLTQATLAFFLLGLVWSLILTILGAFFVIPVTGIAILVVIGLNRVRWLPHWINTRVSSRLGICLILLGLVSGIYESRPSVRLTNLLGSEADSVSKIQVTGFNQFLARRWLISFNASMQQITSIASSLELEENTDFDLRASITKDPFFSKSSNAVVDEIPSTGILHRFARTKRNDQANHWIHLLYSESLQKAWIYRGYQN